MKSSALIIVLFVVSLMASTPVYYNPHTESSNFEDNTKIFTFSDTIQLLMLERQDIAAQTLKTRARLSLILNKIENATKKESPIPNTATMPTTDEFVSIRKEVGDTLRQ